MSVLNKQSETAYKNLIGLRDLHEFAEVVLASSGGGAAVAPFAPFWLRHFPCRCWPTVGDLMYHAIWLRGSHGIGSDI